MTQTIQNNSGGIGFFGLLTIVLITLKLCGVITWSWWLVLCPLLIPLAIILFVVVILVLAFILEKK